MNNTPVTPTPLTDAEKWIYEWESESLDSGRCEVVFADFARTLERENTVLVNQYAQARDELTTLRTKIKALADEFTPTLGQEPVAIKINMMVEAKIRALLEGE